MQPTAYFQRFWESSASVVELVDALRVSLLDAKKADAAKGLAKSGYTEHLKPVAIEKGLEGGSLVKVTLGSCGMVPSMWQQVAAACGTGSGEANWFGCLIQTGCL